MELSPEDKERILAEERERVRARKQAEDEQRLADQRKKKAEAAARATMHLSASTQRWIVGGAILLLVFAVMYCTRPGEGRLGSGRPTQVASPAEYIKDVVAYSEGSDGIAVYMVLADTNGAMTAEGGSGELEIVVDKDSTDEQTSVTVYSLPFSVTTDDFCHVKAGLGAFEHDVLSYVFGRIAYSQFTQDPKQLSRFPSGKVKVRYTTDSGTALSGETTVMF